jgi:hypothetical protein
MWRNMALSGREVTLNYWIHLMSDGIKSFCLHDSSLSLNFLH